MTVATTDLIADLSLGGSSLAPSVTITAKAGAIILTRKGKSVSVAPNRTVTDFVDGVTVVDRRTGTTFTGTVDLRPTLDRIESGVRSPVGRNDGTIFRNNEGVLPMQSPGYYTEYVHPTPGVAGPGPQRVVQGSGGELYYTPDHYVTFIPLN